MQPREPRKKIEKRERPERPVIVHPEPGEVIKNVIPKVTKSQFNIFLVILIGLMAGALVWIITGLIINYAQANRETKRMKRQTAYSIREQKIDQLKTVYNPIQNALSEIENTIGTNNFSKQNLNEYKKAAVEIDLFASEQTINAHKEMINLLSGQQKPSEQAFDEAKNNLLQALKKDLRL